MGTKVKKAVPGLGILDQEPAGRVLCVSNLYSGGIALRELDCGGGDVYLNLLSQAIVNEKWAKNRDLRKYVENGWVSAEWVDSNYEPKKLVDPQDAPNDIRGSLNQQQRAYALKVATSPEDEAVQMTEITIMQRLNDETDVVYMRGPFKQIMTLAKWCEEQTRNRKKVLGAIRDAIKRVNDM